MINVSGPASTAGGHVAGVGAQRGGASAGLWGEMRSPWILLGIVGFETYGHFYNLFVGDTKGPTIEGLYLGPLTFLETPLLQQALG